MIYEPSEDSYLLQKEIEKCSRNKDVLDMGSGSGIIAETAIKYKARYVLAVDLNQDSIELLKSKKIPCRKSNFFQNIKKDEKFDIIAFNPPYLPEDKKEDKLSNLITTGGRHGDEIILKFLRQASKNLNENGIILLIISSFTLQKNIRNLLAKQHLRYRVLAHKKLFFEKLELWEIKHNNP